MDPFFQVLKSDMDVFEALACDSFSLKDTRLGTGHLNDDDRRSEGAISSPFFNKKLMREIHSRLGGAWSQQKPKENFMSAVARKGPPILPPHLLQVVSFTLMRRFPEFAFFFSPRSF